MAAYNRRQEGKQLKARLERVEALADLEDAKKRRARMFARGQAIARSGLERDPAGVEGHGEGKARESFIERAFKGAIDSLVSGWSDAKQTAAWARRGAELQAAEAAEASKVRERIVIRYPYEAEVPKAALARAGFRYDRFSGTWRAEAAVREEASDLAERHGGFIVEPVRESVELSRAAE